MGGSYLIRNTLDTAVFECIAENGTLPGAGLNFQGPAPLYRRSVLAHIQFSLICDANVANRLPAILNVGGPTNPWLANSQHYITANEIVTFICHINSSYCSVQNTGAIPMPLPNIPIFNSGDSVEIVITNIQVGDAITAIRMFWHSWPTGPP
jgi:hypothetical protein